MSKTNNFEIEVIPDPGRTMEGLRDTGYSFESAVADLIDNSIAAGASNIYVRVMQDADGDVEVSITDNGSGMDREGLKQSMQYGSPKRSDPSSLGKFGLGLKTASTAFCRRLSLVSRASSDSQVLMATWDLDDVIAKGKWMLLMSDSPDEDALGYLEELAAGHSGTVVLWHKVDRLLRGYQNPAGSHARKALRKRQFQLEEHIAKTFQRFINTSDERARNICIKLNGKVVEPWDPFQEGLSELVAEESVTVENTSAKFTVRAFILPRREEFENEDLAKAAKISSDMQGLYIYREERLIHDADWLGMFQKEPHGTLLRVEFSFDHHLDDAFQLNIKKSQVVLDDELWRWLKDQFLTAPRREADRRYRQGQKKKITEKAEGAHDASNRSIATKEADAGSGVKVDIKNPKTGEVKVTNSQGEFNLKLKVSSASKPGEVCVQSSDDVEDGMLFEPAIIDKHKAVRVNTQHPYYHKVYVPNFNHSVTVQGMDSLLWALCVAELSTTTDKTADALKDMRYEVTRILRKLVEDLPEPDIEDDVDEI